MSILTFVQPYAAEADFEARAEVRWRSRPWQAEVLDIFQDEVPDRGMIGEMIRNVARPLRPMRQWWEFWSRGADGPQSRRRIR